MAQENDIVLIYFEDSPMTFARIEEITADSKPNWYHVKLLMLQEPLQVVTWILRDIYIDGEEFTMNGKKMRLELVECPDEDLDLDLEPLEESCESCETCNSCLEREETTGGAEIISFSDLKRHR